MIPFSYPAICIVSLFLPIICIDCYKTHSLYDVHPITDTTEDGVLAIKPRCWCEGEKLYEEAGSSEPHSDTSIVIALRLTN